MARFAPGTMGFDLENNAGGRRQRRMADIASGLEGAGGLFTTLAGINQRMQAQADQQAAMPYLARAYQDPFDQGQPGVYGPQRPVMREAMDTAATQQEPSFWGNVGSAFGFGERQGRITPGTLGQIGAIQQRGQDQAMQLAQEKRAAELQPFRVTAARDEINDADIKRQREAAEYPLRYGALETQAATAKQRMAQAGEEFQMRRDRYAAETDLAKARAAKLGSPTATGQPRGDLLLKSITKSDSDYTTLRDLYDMRLAVENGQGGDINDPDSVSGRLAMSNHPAAKLGSSAIWQLASKKMDELRGLNEMQRGGGQGAPSAAPAQRTLEYRTDMKQQPDEESALTEGGSDTQMVQAIAAFKAQHPGAPFDSAAFMGWLSSGR